jgi:hypothetical protein
MTRHTGTALAIATILAAACSRESTAPSTASSPSAPAWTLKLQPLQTPAAVDSLQLQLTVSQQGPLLSWVELDDDKATLKFAERKPDGWSQPQTVASGTEWFVNETDVPSVLRLSNGTLVAAWLQMTNPEREAYDVRLSYSSDNGKAWARSFLPHHDGTQSQHGFVSLFELPGQGLGLIWLDGRATVTPGGPMALRYAAYDAAWKQNADASIDAKVCECCSTDGVVTADGPIVAFRNKTDDEIRDVYVSRLENGQWGEGKSVHDDGWRIRACPVNGPALSANGRNVAMAWFTTNGDQGQSYAALSNDSGRTWSAPVRLDESGSLGRVDIQVLDDGSAVSTWVEFTNSRGEFRARRVERSGRASPAVTIAGESADRVSGVPRLVRHDRELLFAWIETTRGDRHLKSATALLPQ